MAFPYKSIYDTVLNDICSIVPDVNQLANLSGCPVFGSPRYNLEVYLGKYVYVFDIPGVKKEEIIITETNGVVTVKGTRTRHASDEQPNYKYTETKYGSFSRSFTVESDGVCEDMTAGLTDGVLRITIPRKQEVNVRKVTVN